MESNQQDNLKVFQMIADIVADSNFKEGQNQFFEKNAKHFTSEDENKHIYKNIYDEYIKILDEVVEAQILQKMPNVNMEEFLQDLQKNYTTYQQENSDALDILFSFTDFEKFKKSMIQFAEGIKDNEYNEKLQILETDSDYKYCLDLINEPLSNGWKKIIDNKKEQMIVHEKKYKDSGLYMMRSKIFNTGLKYTTVQAIAKDLDSMKEFMDKDQVKEISIIEEDARARYVYMRFSGPLMSDRDYCLKQFNLQDEKNKCVTIISQSVDHPKCPLKKGIIRAEMLKVSKVRAAGQNDESCEVEEVAFNDMKGYIPKMLLNMFISKMATQMTAKFKEVSLKYQKNLEENEKK